MDKDLKDKTWLFLLLVLLLAAALRVYHADHNSLWIDEVNTMVQADPSLGFTETYHTIVKLDLQPPLYFYILKYLFMVFGYTTLVLRLFSAVLGIFAVWSIYLLGRELSGKKAGLYAALLLAVNSYHIYYSQEARPYAFLVLFTILSFYRLLIFLRHASVKNGLLYGLVAALMLYGHPTGLFALLTQCFILLRHLFEVPKTERKVFVLRTLLAGIVIILLYLPAVRLLLNAAGMKSFWIEPPAANVFSALFSEFVGESEFIKASYYLLIVYFFVAAFSKPAKPFLSDTRNAAFVLVLWIGCGTLIPLIRSYLSVPMIVSRYMIGLLPALVLIAALGLSEVKSRLIAVSFVLMMVAFSLTQLIIVKKYYTKPTKNDLRGAAEFILAHKNEKDPIASRIGWHYSSYYLRGIKNEVVMTPFGLWVDRMMQDSASLSAFWYADGASVVEALSTEQQNFVDRRFILSKKINLHGATANHYVPASRTTIVLKLKDFSPGPTEYGFIPLYGNGSTVSAPLFLEKGNYKLWVGGKSQPDPPLNGTNAHLNLKVNGRSVGGIYLPEQAYSQQFSRPFGLEEAGPVTIELVYDNDDWVDGVDRNALIFAVYIEKQ